ncbi:hypothetical protein N0V83_003779 [Neocucurbitaria cava]|uniref:DUF8212 domain-containing protein n=1 Tax=Neocucurbitaria cava TaxID=798079 RepID=A0A9W9CMY0_9PLEO|nr:hypothetical protein N0V83_003779 [Neocucurbitaria cava]
MAMLYGEGNKAFRRLQEEIMKTSSDDSIFAWRTPDGSVSNLRGLLADSPLEFQDSGHVIRPERNRNSYTTLNLGLRIETRNTLIPMESMELHWKCEPVYSLVLDAECENGNNAMNPQLVESGVRSCLTTGMDLHGLRIMLLPANGPLRSTALETMKIVVHMTRSLSSTRRGPPLAAKSKHISTSISVLGYIAVDYLTSSK